MKKYFPILLTVLTIIITICLTTGCDKKGNDTNKENTQNVNSKEKFKFEAEGDNGYYTLLEKEFNCPSISEAILANSNYFYTSDNEYYEYNVELKYSNEQNCKLIGNVENIVAFVSNKMIDSEGNSFTLNIFKDRIISDRRGHYHRLIIDKNYFDFQNPLPNGRSSAIIEDDNIISVFLDSELSYYYVVKDNVYWLAKGDKIGTINKGEKVVKKLDGVIITNENIYNYKYVNYDCFEYLDKQCKMEYVVNEYISKAYNQIIFMNSEYIILNDGSIYNYYLN
jgi:hypothetical protein